MQILLRIFKEVGIAIILLGLLLLVGYFLFRNQVPFLDSSIPNPVEYKGIDYSEFNIDESNSLEQELQKEADVAIQHFTTTPDLRNLETERKVQTGAPNPFVITNSEPGSDLPTEKVSIDNAAIPTEAELAATVDGNVTTTSSDSTADNGEPVSRELNP